MWGTALRCALRIFPAGDSPAGKILKAQRSAVGVALAAQRLWPEGAADAQSLQPVYLRLSQAERERLARESANT